jgi:hypothetical protein
MKQISVSLSDKEIIELRNISNETGLSMSKIISLRIRGYEISKKTAAHDKQELEKPDDDYEDMRDQWFIKNQQRILETTGKMEPNWNNILVKNPELGFKNSKELKNWILDMVLSEAEGGTKEEK